MTNRSLDEENRFPESLQQSLQDMAAQLGETLDAEAAAGIYQEASDLLSHIPHSPITLARVAGTLLVYRVQEAEPGELDWLKFQIKQCPDDEMVEELLESIHRTDAL